MTALLEVADMRVLLPGPRGPLPIVDGVSFEVQPGKVVGIAGESGSGKTMTALALLRLLPPGAMTEGRARFDGVDLLRLSARQMKAVRGRRIAMIFQDPMTSLHPMLSIGRQLTEHMRRHLGISRPQATSRAEELLADVRIPDPARALSAFPHQFSGGMRQRIAIAIALASKPKLLIADEPTTALDVTVQAGILHLLKRLCREVGLGVIFVTHDLGVMASVSDRLCVFYAGQLVESGPTQALLNESRHPYTRGLLSALPQADRKAREGGMAAIPGVPPSGGMRPSGCAFHPRCSYAEPACMTDDPPLLDIGAQRLMACPVDPFRYERAAV